MSYLKDREIWLSNVPTGNPPAGYFWKFIQNGKVVVRDSSGNNQIMVATSGSQAITGSLTVTGGITGTVSSASYVEYSNVANKPALVSGSEQITYSGLTGIPSGIVSGSAQIASFGIFATTGSNGFNGNQSITGSLTVTGQVVAQTLNVQQVTSSVVFSSGSNVFGNSLANTQQFTGSLQVTGSNHYLRGFISVNTTSTHGNLTVEQTTGESGITVNSSIAESPVLYLRDAGGAGYSTILTNNNLYINSSKIGIGTNNPGAKLHVTGTVEANGSLYRAVFGSTVQDADMTGLTGGNGSEVQIQSPSTTRGAFLTLGGGMASSEAMGGIAFYNSNNVDGKRNRAFIVGGQEGATTNEQGAYLSFGTVANAGSVPSERVRINSDGNFLIGSISGTTLNSLTNQLSVSSTTYNLFDISRFSDNAFGPNFYLVKSRNGTIGSNTIVENGDNLGNINWVGANGTGFTNAASIKAEVDGTPGASDDMPGRLVFSTTADGSGDVTERMRITSAGIVRIGDDSNPYLEIANGGSTDVLSGIRWIVGGSRVNYGGVEMAAPSADNGYMIFKTRNAGSTAERMRITSGGNVGIGFTNITNKLQVAGEITTHAGTNTSYYAYMNYLGATYNFGNTETTDNVDFKIAGGGTFTTGGNFRFFTQAGGTTPTERMRITPGGTFKAKGTESTYHNLNASYHELRTGAGGQFAAAISNTAGLPFGLLIDYNSAPNSSSYEFLYCTDGIVSTLRAAIRSNGGLSNFQANDTNLSDERIKKDVIPLESYWGKFKALEIVKFKYKDQTHDDFNIGVIAQQVEAVAPEFVDVDGWNTRPKLDEEGNEIVSEEEPLKSIYTADLHHATIKVLQEAMSKIEEQQTLIESLKSRIEILEQ